ncbi:MAG: hypothetical protein Q8920_02625 [Bacillota bacterium]|nr:hypothetical protein [Bacillota bacterium]
MLYKSVKILGLGIAIMLVGIYIAFLKIFNGYELFIVLAGFLVALFGFFYDNIPD